MGVNPASSADVPALWPEAPIKAYVERVLSSIEEGNPPLTTIDTLLTALHAGQVSVVDLTAPLSPQTPVLQLPPPFAHHSHSRPLSSVASIHQRTSSTCCETRESAERAASRLQAHDCKH